MLEAKAKTKWCPHAVASHTDPRAGFHDDNPDWPTEQPKTFACIGSACMAWRWELEHDGSFNTSLSGPTLEVTRRVPNYRPSAHGYCGLAGAPT